jgi:ornithine decarboxylase
MENVIGNRLTVISDSVDNIINSKIRFCLDQQNEERNDAFFVGDMGDIVRKYKIWMSQLPRVEPFYAVKCNDDASVLAVLAQLGTGFDCASKGEIQKVLGLNVPQSRIIYANPCKQSSHIKYAAAHEVKLMTFDNETELHKVKSFHPQAKMVVRILPPSNTKCQCQLGMKFGCHPKKVPQLLRVAKELGIDVVGVSFHVGSGCYDATAYSAAIASARAVFSVAQAEGFNFSLLDIGGGFPGQASAKLPFEEICGVLRPALDKYFPESMGVRIIAEPGRFFVASAFTLALNVIARRAVTKDDYDSDDETDDVPEDQDSMNGAVTTKSMKATVDDDSKAFMYYLNDGVYGSFNCILFDHAVVEPELYDADRYKDLPLYKSSLWGPTCDGLDCIVKECKLPELNSGEWIIFRDMGAYTMSAASTFNGMPKPKMYHVIQEPMRLSLYGHSSSNPGDELFPLSKFSVQSAESCLLSPASPHSEPSAFPWGETSSIPIQIQV